MIFKKWRDAVAQDKVIVLYMYTNWCIECEKEREEISKTSNEFLDYFNFVEENADERIDLATRYTPGVYPSISIIRKDVVMGGSFGFVDSQKLGEILLLALDLLSGGGNLIEPIRLVKGDESVKWSPEFAFKEIIRRCVAYFDWNAGGFEREPKHPAPEVLRFFLRLRDKYFLTMVEYTLDAAINFLWSNNGGFYLYSKKKDWEEAYPVRLIDMNAEMGLLLFEAYEILKDEVYLEYAIKTIEWIYSLRDRDGLYPNAVLEDRRDESKYMTVNSLVGELFLKAYEFTKDEKYKSEYLNLAEILSNNINHIIHNSYSLLYLIDISMLLNFLSKAKGIFGDKIKNLLNYLSLFDGGDAYYDVTLTHAVNEKIGRFKFLYDNAILANALFELGIIDKAKSIVDYFLHNFTKFAYFNQARYALILGKIYGFLQE